MGEKIIIKNFSPNNYARRPRSKIPRLSNFQPGMAFAAINFPGIQLIPRLRPMN